MTDPAKHILLIEDSNTQAIKLTLYFEEEGWRVSRAASAEEGLNLLLTQSPDLLVVDFFLPGMHGDAFCRQVRLNPATRQVPILMLTAADSDLTQVQGLDSGADDYLPKSEPIEVLLLRIHSLLRKPALIPTGLFQQARLLAIDDSPTYLAYLESELQQEGYLVDTAISGELGLEKVKAHHYDCVLVDLIMPEMDGITFCQHLSDWSRQQLSPLLVLMLTAHDSPTELARALAAGADDFVGKSSDVSVLRGRIRALLRRKFSQDDNQRLLREMIQAKELEAQHARKAQEEAEARASLAQELEIALQQIQASKAELEQLAYISAHDLQEPLRQLTNYTQLLELRCAEVVDSQAQNYLGFISQNTRRMQTQVRSLLAYLSISTRPPEFQSLPLAPLLATVQAELQAELAAAGATLHYPDLPTVQASAYHLKLFFQHLLQNALQFRHPQRPPVIEIRVSETDSAWLLSCQDNGLGIDAQHLERVFQFFQSLEPGPGAGMGLPICRKIAQLHHGSLSLSSELDQSTCLTLTLPKQLGELPSE